MTSETGSGEGPANDYVDIPETSNDNVDVGAADAGAGGGEPNEGSPAEGGVEDEKFGESDAKELAEGDSNGVGERFMEQFDAFLFAVALTLSGAGGEVQHRIDMVKDQLYEISLTVSLSDPGDGPSVHAVSPQEEALMSKLGALLEEAEKLKQGEEELDFMDALKRRPPTPKSPEPPAPGPPGQDRGERRWDAANDNEENG